MSRHLLARQKLLISPRFFVVPNLFATKYSKHNRINALLTSFAQPRNYFNLTKEMLHFTLRLLSTLKYQYMFVFVQHLET